jgi:hypothetical protein
MTMIVNNELVPVVPTEDTLDRAADPAQYVALACERAKAWLADAIAHGEIEQIVELKSQAEAIRIYTQQKQLGKDAELSAAEIVRRAERGLGMAVRRGQEAGTVRRRGEGGGDPRFVDPAPDKDRISPKSLFKGHAEAQDAYSLADTADDDFEEAIEEAKDEGNLSRANVVRKAAKKRILNAADAGGIDRTSAAREARKARIREMAGSGHSSAQIADELGISAETVRALAREIDVKTADMVLGRSLRRIDSNRVVDETANALEGLVMAVGLIEVDALDPDRVGDWATSLSNSLRSLNRLAKQLKEMTQ